MLMVLVVLLLIFLLWYPTPLAQATGVLEIFMMLLAIDVDHFISILHKQKKSNTTGCYRAGRIKKIIMPHRMWTKF